MTHSGGRVLGDNEKRDRLRLARCEGIGPVAFKKLLEQYGSASAVIEAFPKIMAMSRRRLRLPALSELEHEQEAMQRLGARFIAMGEPDYPKALELIDTAPPLLAVQGDYSVLSRPSVAIVGGRNASALGQSFAGRLAADLAAAGYTVISGLARGIDSAAHMATVRSGTVAVVAGGLGHIYPPQHKSLADALAQAGCVVSEMPFSWTATARDFPRRNRIVSGLSLGVVIIEAAIKSGSLITARMALEQGREIMAAPGSPLDPRNEGTNHLIRQGATLIRHAGDVLEVLAPLVDAYPAPQHRSHQSAQAHFDFAHGSGMAPQSPPPSTGQPDRDRLVAVMSPSPVAVDDLVRASGLAPRQVHMLLLELDLEGRVERHGNAMVSLL